MAKNNRTCSTCGIPYRYCPSCYEDRNKEPWHIMFHNENCERIFTTLNDLYFNHITKQEASKQLKEYDLTHLNSFLPNIKKEIIALEQIQAEHEAENKTNKKQNDTPNIEGSEAIIEQAMKPKNKNKKNVSQE